MWDYAYRWITALAGLGLISAVLVAGAAAADGTIRPDDRAVHGPGALSSGASTGLVRPDDRAIHGPGAISGSSFPSPGRPDDRANHGPGSVTVTPIVAQATVGNGFDWIDAGIGAASLVGLGLIGAGGAVLVLRRRRTAAFS